MSRTVRANGCGRPPLRWITRRARRLQRAYGITRRMAIFDAWRDYANFTGVEPGPGNGLDLVEGRRHD